MCLIRDNDADPEVSGKIGDCPGSGPPKRECRRDDERLANFFRRLIRVEHDANALPGGSAL